MMSKTRSAFLSLYAALTPALASAKCGNVDYSWGADALASAHDYAVTMMLYIVYLCYAVAGIVVIVSALQIYINLKSATKSFIVLFTCTRSLITELLDKLRLKYPLLPTIPPYPTMRLETIRSIIPISCSRHPKSVWNTSA